MKGLLSKAIKDGVPEWKGRRRVGGSSLKLKRAKKVVVVTKKNGGFGRNMRSGFGWY